MGKQEAPKVQFGWWSESDKCFLTYDCMEDLVRSHGNGSLIYRHVIKPIGKYKIVTTLKRIKSRKARK